MEFNEIIGKNIRRHRKRLKLTQAQLAEIIFSSNVSVCRWEMGATVPSPEFIASMAQVFGCTTDELYKEAVDANTVL